MSSAASQEGSSRLQARPHDPCPPQHRVPAQSRTPPGRLLRTWHGCCSSQGSACQPLAPRFTIPEVWVGAISTPPARAGHELGAVLPWQSWCWRRGTCSASATAANTARRRCAASSWWCGAGSPSPSPCASRAGPSTRGRTNWPSTSRQVSAAVPPAAARAVPCQGSCLVSPRPCPLAAPPGRGCCCAQLLHRAGEKGSNLAQ